MEFEKYIKENLSEQRSEIDASKMWGDVSSRIDFKEKKRRGFLYWLTSISFLSVVIILLLMFTDIFNFSSPSITDHRLQTQIAKNDNSPNTQTKTNVSDVGDNVFKTKSNNSLSSTSDLKTTATKTLFNNKNLITDSNTQKVSKNISLSEPVAEHPKININQNKLLLKNNTYYSPLTSLPNASNVIKKDRVTSIINKDKKDFISTSKSQIKDTNTSARNLELIKFIPTSSIKNLSHLRDIMLPDLVPFTISEKLKTDKKVSPFYLSIYSGIGISKKDLTSQDTIYAALRNSTESALEHFNITADLQYRLDKNWSIGTGIDYLSLTEKFEWTGSYQETKNGMYIDTIFYSTQIDSTVSFSSGTYTATIKRNMKKYNRYQFINIPISLQYHFKVNEHGFNIQPGVLFNIAYKAKGDYLNNVGAPALLDDAKTSASMQFQMSLNYEREIGDDWKWNIGTALRWAPHTRLGNNAAAIESSYLFYNLRVGLTRRF